MLYGIERLGEQRVRIGAKEFRLVVCDKPLPDGTFLGVEAAGRPFLDSQQQLDIELFKGAFAYQLFKGLYIGIYSPVVETEGVDYMELANPYGSPTLAIALSYTYAKWTEETNLIAFCQRLAAMLLKTVTNCTSARSSPDDICVSISLRFDIPQTADLYEFLRDTDKQINSVTRQLIAPASAQSSKLAHVLKPDEHGYKWWVRYVLIPLAGSAAVFAVVRYLLLRA